MDNFILGPALIPDLKILRAPNSKVDDYHYVVFSAETILKIKNKFHAEKKDNNVNIEHSGKKVEGVFLTNSFIIDEVNKQTLDSKFDDLPIGTWMIEYKIENNEIYQLIKDKKINGFSPEGKFSYERI